MKQKSTTVALETLGCKLNQAESENLARKLVEEGYRIVPPSDGAAIYILNTCTVTHIADRKSRHLLRLACRRNPHALVIAAGCYAERAPQELSAVEGVDMVLGNEAKRHLVQLLKERAPVDQAPANISPLSRTRTMVKIEEGCNQFCSYCIVPLVRGRERSVPMEAVVDEVKGRVALGYKEVVLTGTQIGAYEPSLELLIRRILAQTDIARLHLSSLGPGDITPGLISLWGDGRLCRHLHLPLQSGSDKVLRRMRRRYSVSDYERAVAMVREAIPDVAITTDIMVGFPGESEDEFEESYHFCERMGFAGIHVFPYSERPGTIASRMPAKVEARIRKKRSQRMLHLAREVWHRFREQFLGRTMMVLWEREIEDNVWVGLTHNYIRVFARNDQELKSRLTQARLRGGHNQEIFAVEADLAC